MSRILTIEGRDIPVDEGSFRLTPQQRADVVGSIAQSFRDGDTSADDAQARSQGTASPFHQHDVFRENGVTRIVPRRQLPDDRPKGGPPDIWQPLSLAMLRPTESGPAEERRGNIGEGYPIEPPREWGTAADDRSLFDQGAGLTKAGGVGLAKGLIGLAGEALTSSPNKPVLMDTLQKLQASPHTRERVAEFLDAQPRQVREAIEHELNKIAPANPAPSAIGPAVGRIADRYMDEARGFVDTRARLLADGDAREFARIRQADQQRILEPLRSAPIGQLAQRGRTTPGAIATLFSADHGERQIAHAVGRLVRDKPLVANDLVRRYLETTFNRFANSSEVGANFRQALIGDVQQERNLAAAMSALPNGTQKWDGFKKLLDIVDVTRVPPAIGVAAESRYLPGWAGVFQRDGRRERT